MPHLYTPFNIKDWLDAKMPGANNAKIHVVAHCPTYDDSSKSNTISWKAETQGYYMNFEADVPWKLNLPAVAFRPWRDNTGVGKLYFAVGAAPSSWTQIEDARTEIAAEQDPSENGDGYYHIYLRGEGIRQVTGSEAGACTGTFTGIPTHARISGDLQTLLDWRQVSVGERPEAGEYAFAYMFENWQDPDGTAFKDVIMGTLELPKYCYKGIYKNVKGLKSVAISKGQWLSEGCYESAFEGCTDLEELPEEFNLTVPVLAKRCYARLFYNCRSLKRVPEDLLPAKVMADECYRGMFQGCTSLENAPNLNVTTLAEKCFKSMFDGCHSLTSIPKYPLADVKFAQGCFNGMFRDCEGLVDLREATCGTTGTTADACYQCMFQGCTNLKYPPKIISSGVDGKMMPLQYAQMFDGCTSLIALPEGDLFSGTLTNALAESCFKEMFRGCTSLTRLVPNMFRQYSVFPSHCCEMMFAECSKLKMSDVEQDRTYCIFNINADIMNIGSEAFLDIFKDTGGRWTGNPVARTDYYNYLAINSVKFESTAPFALMLPTGTGTADRIESPKDATKPYGLYYCFDTSVLSPVWTEWKYYEAGGSKLLDAKWNGSETDPKYLIYMKGSNIGRVNKYGHSGVNTGKNIQGWSFRKSSEESSSSPEAGIKVSGQMDCIIDAYKVEMGEIPEKDNDQWYGAFSNWFSEPTDTVPVSSNLVDASGLEPAERRTWGSATISMYSNMFRNCRSLVHPPKVLHQEDVAAWMYQCMFMGCTALTHTPEIKATVMDQNGCFRMFEGCTALTQIADIWLTSFRDTWMPNTGSQCSRMFAGCTSLKTLPILRPRNLDRSCYASMFEGCTALKLSNQPSEDYPTPWKFPYVGQVGTVKQDAVTDMFKNVGAFPSEETLPEGTPVPGKNYYVYSEVAIEDNYVTFYSNDPFTMTTNKSCNGKMYWSGDHANWQEWAETSTLNAVENLTDHKYYLYFRGKNNTIITGDENATVIIASISKVYVKGCLENMLDWEEVADGNHVTPGAGAFYELFAGCVTLDIDPTDGLTFFSASAGGDIPTLPEGMCARMFNGCTALSKLPSMTTLGDGNIPKLFFSNAFENCTSLTTASVPSGTTVGESAYKGMFKGCTGLTQAPALPATTLGKYCYSGMFQGCKALATAPALPATLLTERCYGYVYNDEHPEQSIGGMFEGCTSLATINSISATMFGVSSCERMFYGCTSLESLLTIHIGTEGASLGENCCAHMFEGCTSLKVAPELPARSLAKYCYSNMFNGCTSLTNISDLPATEEYSADTNTYCYNYMFSGCTSLADLSGKNISLKKIRQGTCSNMFYGCKNLTKAPRMDAVTEIADWGCAYMFNLCEKLEDVSSSIPAASVGDNGCYYMFSGCKVLQKIPTLPATSLGLDAYGGMFYDCANVKISTAKHDAYNKMFRIPSSGSLVTTETDIATDMFVGTGGDFKDTPVKETPYYADFGGSAEVPNYVEFYSGTPLQLHTSGGRKTWNGKLYYATGNTPTAETSWIEWELDPEISQVRPITGSTGAEGLYHIYLKGEGNTKLTSGNVEQNFIMSHDADQSVYIYGNISKLLDWETSINPANIAEGAFKAMFYDCDSLVSGPTLDIATATSSIYANMFQKCTKLIAAPTNKMTTTAANCCESMFEGCISLTTLLRGDQEKVFQAQSLSASCYKGMFKNCTSFDGLDNNTFTTLTGTLSDSCCEGMFEGCQNLKRLAGFILSNSCTFVGGSNFKNMYKGCSALNDNSLAQFRSVINGATLANSTNIAAYIFENCTGLTNAGKLFTSDLRITSLGVGCFKGMFKGCSNLVNAGYKIKVNDTYMTPILNCDSCYEEMFMNCTELTDASGWATFGPFADGHASKYCFKSMFENCSKLNDPVVSSNAVGFIFNLNDLAVGCYQRMFYGCSKIDKPAELQPATVPEYAYAEMYANTGVKLATTPGGGYSGPYKVPSQTVTASDVKEHALDNMFTGTAGTWTGTPVADRIYYLHSTSGQTLDFTALDYGATVQLTQTGTGERSIWYRVNNGDWIAWDSTTQPVITLTYPGDKVSFNGYNPNGLSYSKDDYMRFVTDIEGRRRVAVSGDLVALINPLQNQLTEIPCDYCFYRLFYYACITSAPTLSATTLKAHCYEELFEGCWKLETPPASLPATTLADSCYYSLFEGCTSLKTAPVVAATTLANSCCYYMFRECTSLTTAPALPATSLAPECYLGMFLQCSSLTTAPELPATTLADYCYLGMFAECTELTTAPTLSATTLAPECYQMMFYECTSLTTPPALPATVLTKECYKGMFQKCTSLTTSPELPATTLATGCYKGMFYTCTNLVIPPVLSATVLAPECYADMFQYCTNLISVPTLPATGLPDYCYQGMFSGCTSLTSLPALPATTLSAHCYEQMFQGCSNIKLSETSTGMYTTAYRVPASGEGTDASGNALLQMFYQTGGTWPGAAGTGAPTINKTYYLWNLDALCFTANTAGSTVNIAKTGSPVGTDIQYSTNKLTWNTFTPGTTSAITLTSVGSKVYFKGNNPSGFSNYANYYKFVLTGSVAASGSVMSLVSNGVGDETTIPNDDCFHDLFQGCTALTTAPALPATVLKENCYSNMFNGCTRLATTPELPALIMQHACYSAMFSGCGNLRTAPTLPATTLADNCYNTMFMNCSNLATAPALPATTLADYCYQSMLRGCESLTTAPALPAMTLAVGCYSQMFNSCKALTSLPSLPATTLEVACYDSMFWHCEHIKMSVEQTGEYVNAYRIPKTGEGITAERALADMFADTSGTFVDTPSVNTTYYTSNTIINP